MSRAFIPDGYTADCFIKGVANIYEDVRFRYRPVLPEAIRTLMHNYFDKTAQQQAEIVNETLKRQLVEWDICDHEGNPVAITVENLNHITKPLKDRLFNVVTCYDGGDLVAGDDTTTGEESALNFDALLPAEQAKN